MVTQEQITTQLHSEVLSLLGPLTPIPSGWRKQNCKLCHHRGHGVDKKQRFGLKIEGDSIVAHCFNCKFGASWEPGKKLSKPFEWFLQHIGMSQYDVKRISFEIYKLHNNMETSSTLVLREDVTKTWKEVELPKDSMTISEWARMGCSDANFIKVIKYLESRSLLYPNDFYWTPSTDKMYNKRVIVPYYYEGKLVGFTGRYAGEPANKKLPKYMDTKPASYILNLDAQKDPLRKYVILVEGVFDSYVTDGIAIMGNEPSADQISIINKLGKEIIVVPDKDKAGQVLFNVAVKEGWSISTPKWGRGIKDPANATEKYGRILTLQTIIEARDKSAFAAKLKRQMDKF